MTHLLVESSFIRISVFDAFAVFAVALGTSSREKTSRLSVTKDGGENPSSEGRHETGQLGGIHQHLQTIVLVGGE